ncbi:MAG TPA: hypothetical protein VK543_03930 [Puia sp.]|nr:hypothetical protein [Puia sp.]
MENSFLVLSKNSILSLKNYIWGDTQDFLHIVQECFDVVYLGEEVVEIKFPKFTASIYYASELNRTKGKITGHILIYLNSDMPIPISEIQSLFKDLVIGTNSYLFLILGQEEKLLLKFNCVGGLN